jgi:hypothetical protein
VLAGLWWRHEHAADCERRALLWLLFGLGVTVLLALPAEFLLSPHAPVGRRAGVKALVRGCPPDAVVSLALKAVSQSGAGAL